MRRHVSSIVLGGALAALLTLGTAGVATAGTSTTSSTSGPWAAIAVGPNSGAVGVAWNHGSRNAAAAAARARCGAGDCADVVEVANGCASLAQAPTRRLGWAYGRSRADSDRIALREAGRRARILAWACSGDYA